MQNINPQVEIKRLNDIVHAGILSQNYREISVSESNDNMIFSIPKDFFTVKVTTTTQKTLNTVSDKTSKKMPTSENTLSPFEKMFGFMDKDMEIPDDFDEMCADEIEQLFAGKESSDEYLI